MSWENFYLFCFCVGFLCSLLSFLAGSSHSHLHLPKGLHGHPATAPAARDLRRRPSTSEPSRLFWRGSAAWDIC